MWRLKRSCGTRRSLSKSTLAYSLFPLLIVLLAGRDARAWNATAHKITASIAFRRLSEPLRQQVSEVLRQHPRFKEDFLSKMPVEISSGDAETQAEWIFQQAAVWPDLARGLRGENRKMHHATWHYINRPQFLTDLDRTTLAEGLKLNLELTGLLI